MYKHPLIDNLIRILDRDGPTSMKGKYLNGPMFGLPNKSELPMASIRLSSEGQHNNMSGGYETTYSIEIRTIANTRETNSNSRQTQGYSKLVELISARDNNLQLKTKTIIRALQKNAVFMVGDTQVSLALKPATMMTNFAVIEIIDSVYTIEATTEFTATTINNYEDDIWQ